MSQESSKKILLFTTAYKPFVGGSELAIQEIIKRLAGWSFDIVTPKLRRDLLTLETFENCHIHRIGFGFEKIDKLLFTFSGFNYARKLIGQNDYRLVHVFQASHAAGAAWRLKLTNKKLPLVVTLQEGKDLDKQNFWIKLARKIILSKADQITAISKYLKEYAKKIKNNTHVAIIPNGVDVGNFSREFSYGELSELKDQLGIKPGEKVVVSVSRLVPKNGIYDLIKGFAMLPREISSHMLKLLLIGTGPEKNNLDELAVELGIRSKVIFVGDIGHDELSKFLKISDVFVRPSLSEGLGSAFLEAMAAGVPIIGTNVGGIPDFLKDGKTGLFCLPGDPESIAEKIQLLLNDHDLRQRVIANALELVKEKYDWEKIAAEYEQVYLSFAW